MTLAQIYDAVCNLVYGDVAASPVPAAEVPFIQILILQKHHEVQQNYNFWFNRFRTTFDLMAGVDTYALPENYKELISIDYEGSAEFINNDIVFTEPPTEDKTVQFDLWKFLPTPLVWNGTFTDNVTLYCHMGIIYMVTAIMMLKRDEKAAAQSYLEIANQALESVYAEDYGRRQTPGAIF